MPLPSEPLLSRDRAWSCVMMNAATPGTGSIRAGRRMTGICQLGFAVAGFCFGCAWIFGWCHRIIQAQIGEMVSKDSIGWLWECGVACFGISWVWTFLTCVSLVREAKRNELEKRKNVPPIL